MMTMMMMTMTIVVMVLLTDNLVNVEKIPKPNLR